MNSLGLGKGGIHSTTVWESDVRVALEQLKAPTDADLGTRRHTVIGGEPVPQVPSIRVVQEDDNVLPATTGLSRAKSTHRALGLRVEVPHSANVSCSSILSMTLPPPSSRASSITLFDDFVAELEQEVQAQSTPHNSNLTKTKHRQSAVPPMPKETRRSSIVYIKSDDHVSSTNSTDNETENTPPSTISTLAQWSSRAVRPLLPKASKLSLRDSTSGNLRQLSLLQNRDVNATTGTAKETRPLSLKGRKSKLAPVQDENARPDSASISPRKRNLKPLRLGRSDTTKMRGLLRKDEVIPEVVVRPPSNANFGAFAYSYRD
jgi:hypothetical protein